MRYSKCIACSEYVGWIGLVVNLTLSALKIFVGVVSGSHALVADAMYSAKDFITSALIIVGLKVSKKTIDKEHPYGHGKIEFIISGMVSLVFIGITGLIFYYAAETIFEGEHTAPHFIAIWTALLAILISTVMYHYTRCVAIEINSPIVHALAKHHGGDRTSSAAVALGILGSHYLGMPWLDSLVAIAETIHLLFLGYEILKDSYKGLMDSSPPDSVIKEIRKITLNVAGVKDVESIRARRVGQSLWVDLKIGVDPELSVKEAKIVAENVELELMDSIEHIGMVNVDFGSEAGSVPEFELLHEEKKRNGMFSPQVPERIL